jgi:hypothetical protein
MTVRLSPRAASAVKTDAGREKRRALRRNVVGPALIIGPGVEAICVIRDLSATGAKIEVASSVELPPAFNLLLRKTNSSRHVLLRWRRGDFAGVEFVFPPGLGR